MSELEISDTSFLVPSKVWAIEIYGNRDGGWAIKNYPNNESR